MPASATANPPETAARMALYWASILGVNVFPLPPGEKIAHGLSFTAPGASFQDEATVRAAFGGNVRDANIGWRTGGGRVVLDLDVKHGQKGPETMLQAAWAAGVDAVSILHLADLTGAALVETPSGGYHLIWDSGGHEEFSHSNRIWRGEFGEKAGIDVRGRNGYCLAPGSWLPEASEGKRGHRRYRLLHMPACGLLGPVPDWAAARLVRWREDATAKPRVASWYLGAVPEGMERWPEMPAGGWHPSTTARARAMAQSPKWHARQGNRNNVGFGLACDLTRGWLLPRAIVRAILHEWNARNVEPPLPGYEVEALAHRGENGQRALGSLNPEIPDFQAEGAEETGGADRPAATAIPVRSGDGGGGEEDNEPSFERRSFRDIEEQDLEWAVDTIFPIGVLGLLLGVPGLGKSQLLYRMMADLTHGCPFAGRATRKGKVLLITHEDDPGRVIKRRLRAAGVDMAMIDHLHQVVEPVIRGAKVRKRKVMFDLSKHVEALRRDLAAHPDTRVVIIDPLNAYFGAKADSYKASDIYALLTPFVEVAQEANVALVGVLHPPRSSMAVPGSSMMRTPGGQGLTGVTRALWEILPDPRCPGGGNMLFVNGKPSYTGTNVPGFGFRIEGVELAPAPADGGGNGHASAKTSRAVILEESVDLTAAQVFDLAKQATDGRRSENANSAKQQAKDLILKVLEPAPHHQRKKRILDLAKKAGISQATVYRAYTELETAGAIHTTINPFDDDVAITSLNAAFGVGLPIQPQ